MLPAVILAATLLANCPPAGFAFSASDDSPKHTFRIEQYRQGDKTLICLRDAHGRTAQLGSPSVLQVSNYIYVSPDDHWIARVQHFHRWTTVHLYERHGAVDFAEVGPKDFRAAAWDFFRHQTPHGLKPGYTGYTSTGTWLPNSHTLLVELNGDDGSTQIASWYCYYDLETHRFYRDERLKEKDSHAIVVLRAKT